MNNIKSEQKVTIFSTGLTFTVLIMIMISCNENSDKPDYELNRIGDKEIVKLFDNEKKLVKEYELNKLDQFDGYYKEFYHNGGIKNFYNYSKGSLHGIQKRFYENGNLNSVSYFINSQIDSIQKWFYQNGRLKSELFWLDGKQFGIQKQYTESGYLDNIYFMIGDSSKSLDISFDTAGNIVQLEGKLLNCVYADNKINIGDTLQMVCYATIPTQYSYSAVLTEEKSGSLRSAVPIEFSKINNNYGYLLERKYKESGQYKLKLSLTLKSKTTGQVFRDTLSFPFSVN
jgi:antitoxin component YwqK of YwqJK toxin-antitoxin module